MSFLKKNTASTAQSQKGMDSTSAQSQNVHNDQPKRAFPQEDPADADGIQATGPLSRTRPEVPLTVRRTGYVVSPLIQLPDGGHLRSSYPAPISWVPDEVSSSPSEGTTKKGILRRKAHHAWTLLKNPRADPDFYHLPPGLNNRIDPNKDPLRDKLHRLRRRKKKTARPIHQDNLRQQFPHPIHWPAPDINRASPRRAPAVGSHIVFDSIGPAFDKHDNPLGGEHSVMHERADGREKRNQATQRELGIRASSDRFLAQRKQKHIRNSLIGRAPPLPKRFIAEEVNRLAWRSKEIPRVEADPTKLGLPIKGARVFQWDHAILARKNVPSFPGIDDNEETDVSSSTSTAGSEATLDQGGDLAEEHDSIHQAHVEHNESTILDPSDLLTWRVAKVDSSTRSFSPVSASNLSGRGASFTYNERSPSHLRDPNSDSSDYGEELDSDDGFRNVKVNNTSDQNSEYHAEFYRRELEVLSSSRSDSYSEADSVSPLSRISTRFVPPSSSDQRQTNQALVVALNNMLEQDLETTPTTGQSEGDLSTTAFPFAKSVGLEDASQRERGVLHVPAFSPDMISVKSDLGLHRPHNAHYAPPQLSSSLFNRSSIGSSQSVTQQQHSPNSTLNLGTTNGERLPIKTSPHSARRRDIEEPEYCRSGSVVENHAPVALNYQLPRDTAHLGYRVRSMRVSLHSLDKPDMPYISELREPLPRRPMLPRQTSFVKPQLDGSRDQDLHRRETRHSPRENSEKNIPLSQDGPYPADPGRKLLAMGDFSRPSNRRVTTAFLQNGHGTQQGHARHRASHEYIPPSIRGLHLGLPRRYKAVDSLCVGLAKSQCKQIETVENSPVLTDQPGHQEVQQQRGDVQGEVYGWCAPNPHPPVPTKRYRDASCLPGADSRSSNINISLSHTPNTSREGSAVEFTLPRQPPFVIQQYPALVHGKISLRGDQVPLQEALPQLPLLRRSLPQPESTRTQPTSQLAPAGDGAGQVEMDMLQVRPTEFSSVKAKAIEDAKQMQATVLEAASKAGKPPPKYALLELIGKGGFGRVYKGKDMTSAAIVAVKIIDIDESDTINPRNADSYSEFLKEVNALKILSENQARNINHVIEALPVGQSMWMITEYCGGGSIATLMKPTAPGGLQEKWIIPIIREVAEAIKWVHQAGIIHRDIKCANVLITEQGGVQLCDFGVAGIIENTLDKRSTVIGTPHWMAPELFSSTPSYGKEVDIWAFGSMIFEIATGLPPNATLVPYERLGSHLKTHVTRLEGGNYSNDLRSLVAYCLEELPSARPTIEQVQKHPYIYNTNSRYPASSLSHLVRAFKVWEDHGGSRKSLFMLGGAQGPSIEGTSSVPDDEWNFSTTASFDQEVSRDSTAQDVYEAYGTSVELENLFTEDTSRPKKIQTQKSSRRRPPPEALARLPAPLEKIFDPNTLSNYEDNSRSHYGRQAQPATSDLPLRDDSAQTSIRDTMIDLGGHDSDAGLSDFPDMETTIQASRYAREETSDGYSSTSYDFSRPALSDPADTNPNRRTQDWKFPSMVPPASADPELARFPTSYEFPRLNATPSSGNRPALVHHPTEPLGAFGGGLLDPSQTTLDRLSMRESLIDLDMSMPDVVPEIYNSVDRPSTASSDVESETSDATASTNPFALEKHVSLIPPRTSSQKDHVDHSTYLTDQSSMPMLLKSSMPMHDLTGFSDIEGQHEHSNGDIQYLRYRAASISDSESRLMPPPSHPTQSVPQRPTDKPYNFAHFPELPLPPSERALSGSAGPEEMKDEFNRMLWAMTAQLEAFRDVYSSTQITKNTGPAQRRERKDGENRSHSAVP